MNTLLIGVGATLCITSLLSCAKPHNTAPVADTETTAAVDVTWATLALVDIEQQAACLGEQQPLNNMYVDIPGSNNPSTATGSITLTNDINSKGINLGYNKTHTYDGKLKDGTIWMFYGYDADYDKFVQQKNTNAKYFHDWGMVARISLIDYMVDGWKIEVDPNKHGLIRAVVANLMPPNYVAAAGPIRWRFVGDFILHHPTDPNKDMSISVDLEKALMNSSDQLIYNQSQIGSNIQWTNFTPLLNNNKSDPKTSTHAAYIAYTGTVCGAYASGERFKMVIDEKNPLVRDFTCYADKIAELQPSPYNHNLVPIYKEFHPFIQGVSNLTTECVNTPDINTPAFSKLYPRRINYGNEELPELNMQCDNAGTVLIKGVLYKVDFRQ